MQARHDKDSGPAAYPSIVVGCNYGTCTRDTPFPRPISDLGDVRSSWAVTVPERGDYNVAYDVWLDPTPRREGANTGAELMIWLDRTERVQPIGAERATVLDLPISDFLGDATRSIGGVELPPPRRRTYVSLRRTVRQRGGDR